MGFRDDAIRAAGTEQEHQRRQANAREEAGRRSAKAFDKPMRKALKKWAKEMGVPCPQPEANAVRRDGGWKVEISWSAEGLEFRGYYSVDADAYRGDYYLEAEPPRDNLAVEVRDPNYPHNWFLASTKAEIGKVLNGSAQGWINKVDQDYQDFL